MFGKKMKIKCFRQQKKIRLQNVMPPDFDQTIETWKKETNEQITMAIENT